jgi:hypothetical protein
MFDKIWNRLSQSNTIKLALAQVVTALLAILGGKLTWKQGGVVAAIGILQIIQREFKLRKEDESVG